MENPPMQTVVTRQEKMIRNRELCAAMRDAIARGEQQTARAWAARFHVTVHDVYNQVRHKRLAMAIKRGEYKRTTMATVYNSANDDYEKVSLHLGKKVLAEAGLVGVPIAVSVANGCVILTRQPEPPHQHR
jgi:hypothetical protein